KVGKGTTVSVSLPLGQSRAGTQVRLAEPDNRFSGHLKRLAALRVYMYGFGNDSAPALTSATHDVSDWKMTRTILEEICRDWMHMEVLSEGAVGVVADLNLTTEAAVMAMIESAHLIAICSRLLFSAAVLFRQISSQEPL